MSPIEHYKQELWMTVIFVSLHMIRECFWVVLHKSIDVAAIATIGHHCSGDIEKETRRLYDRKSPSSMSELIKRGYLTTTFRSVSTLRGPPSQMLPEIIADTSWIR